ncbi:transglutaminase domain-containing protein [Candidatus Villigracilis affinis]|uniref:DUF4129 domain-containing transglutaminase family protein n=1 Tax=Candidatus Villigracilis affinis TaxID=3140682 RepID=UPI001DE605F9|nr:transglutaminase domain-containing protein [Anaerolineales bacterium]
MKKLFSLRSFLTWLILLLAMGALGMGLKDGILDVQDAAFFPVAAFAVTLAYLLGFGASSPRRVWIIVLVSGFLFAIIESARLIEPFKLIIRAIPPFERDLLLWFLERDSPEAVFPDTSIFLMQFTELTHRANTFFTLIFSASLKHPMVREFIWDLPILLCAAWAGWKTSRHNQTFLALAPALVLQTYILEYTSKDLFSLQLAIFTLIMLIGVNQKWNFTSRDTEGNSKTARETYSAILILSIALTLGAGFMPSISIREVAQKLSRKDDVGKALGLDKASAQAYVISGATGLPRQHLIGLSPTLAKTVMFTVQTGELAPTENSITNEAIPRHYWRWLTYDIYNGQGWSTSPVEGVPYSANESILQKTDDSYSVIHQQVEKSFSEDSRLYWTGLLATADQPFNVNWRTQPPNEADMLGVITETKSYQADSFELNVNANQLRASSLDYPTGISETYLTLPDTVPQRVRDLAESLTANAANPYDKAKAIERYLRTYPYSLDVTPPAPNQDVADYFLFELKKGYCDYYATSMVVMARSVGLPARLVIGYANGIYDARSAQYIIREADAHSWVEIYFTEVGWVEFEPTAGQLELTLPDDFSGVDDSFVPIIPSAPLRESNDFVKLGRFPEPNIFIPLAALAIVILFASLWFLRVQGLLRSHETVASIYGYIYYHGKKIYKDAPINETPTIFSAKLRARLRSGYEWLAPAPDEIRFLTDLYLQETYSAHPVSKDERRRAIRVWQKLFWRLLYAQFKRM